jgi:hypothetical protein
MLYLRRDIQIRTRSQLDRLDQKVGSFYTFTGTFEEGFLWELIRVNPLISEPERLVWWKKQRDKIGTPTNPQTTNPRKTNPRTTNPRTTNTRMDKHSKGQTLERTNTRKDKHSKGQTLERTNPRKDKPSKGQTLDYIPVRA